MIMPENCQQNKPENWKKNMMHFEQFITYCRDGFSQVVSHPLEFLHILAINNFCAYQFGQ